jgi:hypothetical protein
MRSADWRSIRRTPYEGGVPPSAADGTDLVIAFRYGRRVESWANFEHVLLERTPLMEGLGRLLRKYGVHVPL